MTRVFMDSGALFAAIVSSAGAARALIRLAVNEEIQLVISEDVVTETRCNISSKAPELARLLDRLSRMLISSWYPIQKGSAAMPATSKRV